MNIHVLLALVFFLTPGGCPMYSIDLSTLEVPNDFQDELTLQSMLNSELEQSRNDLNDNQRSVPDDPPGRHRGKRPRVAPREELLPEVSHRAANNNAKELFLGTNLFGSSTRKCFSAEEIALIAARRDFESLLPKSFPSSLLCDSVVQMLMKYFHTVNRIVKSKAKDEARMVLQRAYYDALGGYLRYYLVPVAQISFYAGRLKLNTTERLVSLYQQCRIVLNTNGNGWRTPMVDVLSQLKSVRIRPVSLPAAPKEGDDDALSCALLEQSSGCKEAQNDQMIVPLPRLEAVDGHGHLTLIYLPLKQRRIYNLRSPQSAFVLVKFFQTVTQCYRFQGMCQRTYNRKLRNWIRESLQLHYRDEVFYPGLGGVLQVYEMLKIEDQGKAKQPVGEGEGECEEEQCFRGYQQTTDDVTDTGRVAVAGAGAGTGDNCRKQSRSPNTKKQEEDKAEKHYNKDGEECRECDDDPSAAFVAWLALFLFLLLLFLLLLIYCCMKKGRKPQITPRPNRKRVPAVQDPKSTKIAVDSNPSMPRRMAIHGSYYSSPIEISQSEKSPQGNDNDFRRFLDESHTSTSSLACQFNRKCLPVKFSRSSPDQYYPKKKRQPTTKLAKQKVVQAFHPLDTDDSELQSDTATPGPSPRRKPPPAGKEEALDQGRYTMPTLESYRTNTTETERTDRAPEKQKVARRCDKERCEGFKQTEKHEKEPEKQKPSRRCREDRCEKEPTETKRKEKPPEKSKRKEKKLETDTGQDERRKPSKKSDPKAEPTEKRLSGGGYDVRGPPKDSPGWETVFEDSSIVEGSSI
ncbi:uncharacterized protein LOC6587666 [Drosophila persimilis]|uniref:uncharacterized protein LOC6587666 n=1 Tax=Drosophila persimilis TaxID=7234 RepID=UPI000F0925C5|nr:uncharacterized protein LOC6587666 [Drosophila persimilis]